MRKIPLLILLLGLAFACTMLGCAALDGALDGAGATIASISNPDPQGVAIAPMAPAAPTEDLVGDLGEVAGAFLSSPWAGLLALAGFALRTHAKLRKTRALTLPALAQIGKTSASAS